MVKRYLIFSSIGPPIRKGTDPIYEVAVHFPPVAVFLFSSDEPPPPTRESVDVNIEQIREYFANTSVPVDFHFLPLDTFEENVYTMASKIIQLFRLHTDCQIILDLSAGRVVISHALARAGQVVIDYLDNIENTKIEIICGVRPREQPLITYHLGTTLLTNEKDAELLKFVESPVTQSALAKNVSWNNQSDISKSISRLKEKGLLEVEGHRKRKLTNPGKLILNFLQSVFY